MQTVTVRVEDRTLAELEHEADRRDQSRSERIRDALRSRHDHDRVRREYEQELADLQERVDELEAENGRLQNRVEKLVDDREERQELVAYAETERERQLAREEAGILTRTKWFLVGRSSA